MSMADGTESAAPAAAEAAPSGPDAQGTTAPAGGGNGAWDELRSEAGETTFRLIEPHLKKWESQSSGRIQKASEDLKRYTDLGDFDSLSAGRTLTQQLEADPVAFYRNLDGLLRQQGLLEAGQTTAPEGVDEDEEDVDPRVAELQARLDAIEGATTEQQTQAQYKAWNDEWDGTFKAAKDANPWLSDDDDRMLRRLAQDHINSDNDRIPDIFGKALADLSNYRTRTLQTPRAGDSAPRLIQAGGGNPAAAQTADVTKMGRRETVDMVTNLLKARQG